MTAATGAGSLPGTDAAQAARMVRDLLGDEHVPFVAELPGRGPGADMVGRAAGLLVEMPVDLQPAGWRLVDRPGRDAARTASLWRQDLDVLAEVYDGYAGPLTVAVAGPWTLSASLELTRGERAVADPGARRDLTASLAEGVRTLLRDLGRLVPAAALRLQLDEPSLPAVLGGRLPTASGYGRIRAVDLGEAREGLRVVLAAADGRDTIVHCCADAPPLPLVREAGAGAIYVDTTRLTPAGWESVAATVDSGVSLIAGAVTADIGVEAVRRDITDAWERTGLSAAALGQVLVAARCGLAGMTWAGAVETLKRAVAVARALADSAGS